MDLKEFLKRMDSGVPVESGSEVHLRMLELSFEAMRVTFELNGRYHDREGILKLFSELTGREVDPSFMMFPPFYTDCGKNISVGKDVFINSGCSFQDQGGIRIGDGALIGHNVVMATLNHGLAPEDRGTLYPAPIAVGRNVWIGAKAVILPGVTVGDDAAVAAGAVVTRDVAAGTLVGGVPARLMRWVGRDGEARPAKDRKAAKDRKGRLDREAREDWKGREDWKEREFREAREDAFPVRGDAAGKGRCPCRP